MTGPEPPEPAPPTVVEPPPTVVEWGAERPRLLARLGAVGQVHWWHPAIPAVLAGLGALALFGSLVGEWQVVGQPFDSVPGDEPGPTELTFSIAEAVVWGTGWLVGAMVLASCGGLALFGPPPLRRYTRAVGLAVAGVLLVVLVAAAQNLREQSTYFGGAEGFDVDIELGRGVYAAFASVVLFGLALGLAGFRAGPAAVVTAAGPPTAAAPAPAQRLGPPASGPDDLRVGPAEPLTPLSDDYEWR